MKWSETIASECRYGDVAAELFGDAEIIWEDSLSDYQGYAHILAHMPDGQFAHYTWTYGSCSGCDEWEDRGLSDKEIVAEMKQSTLWLKDKDQLRKYLKLEEEYKEAGVPTANSPTNGSIPGMLYCGFGGGLADAFVRMGEAAEKWLDEHKD